MLEALACYFWLRLLQILPLSIAYPMLSINFIVVTLIGQFIYKETVNVKHWIGYYLDYVRYCVDEYAVMKTGYLWAIASALLVTVAQLLLKIGMSELPDLQLEKQWFDLHWLLRENIIPISVVFVGLIGYVLSMVCWLLTFLRSIP